MATCIPTEKLEEMYDQDARQFVTALYRVCHEEITRLRLKVELLEHEVDTLNATCSALSKDYIKEIE